MRKIILFALFILGCIQLMTAQKITLTYKVKTSDSLYIFQDNAFSDKNIQTKSKTLFSKYVQDKNIISIEDNINRKFGKTEFNHITYYSRLLDDGHFKLYELEVNNKFIYLVCSKNDTLALEKKDSVVNQTIINDRMYNNKLVTLAKDYPDLWDKARNVNFRKKDLQNFISLLNDKYSSNNNIKYEKNNFDYLNIALQGFLLQDMTNIMLDISITHYFIDFSPNVSLRYGLRVNYYKRTIFVPAAFTGLWTVDQNGNYVDVYFYGDHHETATGRLFEIPLSVNYEITNSTITPFMSAGVIPALLFRTITRTDSKEINKMKALTLNAFVAGGIKLKLTNTFNILSELSFELIKGVNFSVGVEYYIKL